MGLEAASYISQLDSANPGGSDAYSTADDHLRLIKAVLKTQFPNLGAAAVSPTAAELNVLVGSTGAVERQANKNAASGYAGLDASSRLTKTLQHTQTAYLDAANVFTADQRIQNTQPNIYLRETDAGANAKLWRIVASGETMLFMLGDDAEGTFNSFLMVGRSGATPGAITFTGTSMTLNGTNVMLTNTAVTNGQVPQSAVTQHQAALAIAFTQLTGSIASAQVPVGAVTQHQGSLSIATSQLTGTLADARVAASNVTQHQASLSIATSQLTGSLPDARVAQSNVTQHQAALSIGWGQLTGIPGSFTPSAHNQDASTINSGTFADARIALSNVSQHAGSIKTRNHGSKAGTTVTLSTADPSGGTDGDLWYKY